jgi:hypothetical protein
VRGRDPAFQPAQRLGDLEVCIGQGLHRAIGQVLYPGLQRVGALHDVAVLVVQLAQRLGYR